MAVSTEIRRGLCPGETWMANSTNYEKPNDDRPRGLALAQRSRTPKKHRSYILKCYPRKKLNNDATTINSLNPEMNNLSDIERFVPFK